MLETSLSGVRVLDFTHLAAGPICSMLLGDMGADVVKIEPPQGDLARKLGPPWINGEGVTFMAMNRSKRSMVLDIKAPGGVELVKRLVRECDVVLESFRPGVMERLGIGYEALRQERPDLVFCSITAYGQDGPWRDKPGVDGVLHAVSGLMSISGNEGEPPSKPQTPIIDMVTGFMAVTAILAALRQRSSSGEGAHLDVNMYASALMLQQTSLASYLATGELPQRTGSAAPYAAPNEAFEASDGYLMVAAYQPDRWRKLCELLGVPELVDDPRFIDIPSRVANRGALVELLNARFRQQPRRYWLELLEGADLICGAVCDYSDVVASPQVAYRSAMAHIQHPIAGDVAMPAFMLGEVHPQLRSRPPLLGEHTVQVLSECGLTSEEITQLLATGTVQQIFNSSLQNCHDDKTS